MNMLNSKIMKEKFRLNINVIPNGLERYMSFTSNRFSLLTASNFLVFH